MTSRQVLGTELAPELGRSERVSFVTRPVDRPNKALTCGKLAKLGELGRATVAQKLPPGEVDGCGRGSNSSAHGRGASHAVPGTQAGADPEPPRKKLFGIF